jgi:hypothetical protein
MENMFSRNPSIYPSHNRTKALTSTLSYILNFPLGLNISMIRLDSLITKNMQLDNTGIPLFADTAFKQTLTDLKLKKHITVQDRMADNLTLSNLTQTYTIGNYFIVLKNGYYAALINGKLIANPAITSNLNLMADKIYQLS